MLFYYEHATISPQYVTVEAASQMILRKLFDFILFQVRNKEKENQTIFDLVVTNVKFLLVRF